VLATLLSAENLRDGGNLGHNKCKNDTTNAKGFLAAIKLCSEHNFSAAVLTAREIRTDCFFVRQK
jgi:hypothetical protein